MKPTEEQLTMNKRKRKVDWSFDFEDMGERLSQFFSDMAGEEVEVKSAELAAPRDGATSARIEIDFSVGKANLTALAADSDNLFEAQIDYIGEYEFEISGGDERVVSLRQKGKLPRGIGRMIGNKADLIWDIALAPNTPYRLSMKGGIGETNIDLSNLLVDGIKLEYRRGQGRPDFAGTMTKPLRLALMAGSARRMWSFRPAAAASSTLMAAWEK